MTVVFFDGARSLARERRLGPVHDRRWQISRLTGFALLSILFLWDAVGPAKEGTVEEYVELGLAITAIATLVYGIRGRRPTKL